MYMGMSPYDAPGTYSLLQYTELAEGIWYPIGGFNKVSWPSCTCSLSWLPEGFGKATNMKTDHSRYSRSRKENGCGLSA